jgi:glycosyltransferase involved in cell wall biosynthesis
MTIALMHDGGPISGISTHIYKIFANLKFHKESVDLFQCLQWAPEIDLPPGTIVLNGSKPRQKYRSDLLRKISSAIYLFSGSNWRSFRNIKADVTILSNPSLLKLTKYLPNCGVIGHDIYYAYNTPDSKLLTYYFRNQYKLFDSAKFVFSNSEFTKNEMISKLGISADKIFTVYPYFDNTLFYPGKSEFRQGLNLRSGDKIILSVGSDQPNKNVDTIIKVMTRLPDNYILVRIGRTSSTKALIHGLSLEGRVILKEKLGEQELADIYRGSDLLLFPSLFEGFGSPVVEAMASGLPFIVSNRGALPEVAGSAGVISDPLDVDYMVERILDIIEDESKMKRFRKLSTERATFFSMDNQYKQIVDALKKQQ